MADDKKDAKKESKEEAPKKSVVKLILIALVAVLVIVGGGGYFYISSGVDQILQNEKVTVFQIKKGESLHKLCSRMEKEQLVSGCLPLKIYSKLSDKYTPIKSGTYELGLEMSFSTFLLAAVEGRQKEYAFTIIEGDNIYQVLNKLDSAKYLNNDLKGKSIKKVAEALDLPYESPEGWLFPETYNYPLNSDASDLLKRAIKKQKELLTSLWPDRNGNLAIYKPYQALILASIIEKESSAAGERNVISSVFHNRLRKPMRLQTDPTVIYGIWDEYKGDITREHLNRKTRYNTYRINGLPPTPIANASRASLEAALNPASTDYYYFVASGDGEHVFNQTLEQHNRAVRNYLRKQRLLGLKKKNG